jgi:hypothetical protein
MTALLIFAQPEPIPLAALAGHASLKFGGRHPRAWPQIFCVTLVVRIGGSMRT